MRCAMSGREGMSVKRRQRFARYEQELLQCGDDIRSLQRFVNAQVVAFRKILKKYRKWTGSSALGSRFRDTVLSHPKSFTKHDFSPLESQYADLAGTLQTALPATPGSPPSPASPASPLTPRGDASPPSRRSRQSNAQLSPSDTIVASEPRPQVVAGGGYWNEYEHGSEAGDLDRDADGGYAIYIDPNEEIDFFGLKALGAYLKKPVKKLNTWMSVGNNRDRDLESDDGERDRLLPTHAGGPYGSVARSPPPELGHSAAQPGGTASLLLATDTDGEDESYPQSRRRRDRGRRGSQEADASSMDEPLSFAPGYRAHYPPLSSVDDPRAARYRERVLAWGTWACYGVAFMLTAVAAALIVAGRHKRGPRLAIDVGVTLGIMTSLGLVCAALCMSLYRQAKVPLLARLAVWATFAVACAANGALLVLVMGRAGM